MMSVVGNNKCEENLKNRKSLEKALENALKNAQQNALEITLKMELVWMRL